jgi:hypothetical protein
MLDTVAGKLEPGPWVPSDMSRNYWETREREFYDEREGARVRSISHTLNRPEARIQIYGDGGGLRIEASLPKLLYGNNLSRLSDPFPALERLSEFARDHVKGLLPDLIEMEYLRVDYCHNFQVGTALNDYVQTLARLPYLRHNRITDVSGGVEWWNGSRRIRVYDKWREIKEKEKLDVPAAKGILRFEIELRKKSGFIERRLHTKRLTFREVLDPEAAYLFLNDALNRMCLKTTFCTQDHAKSILDFNFGYVKATRLLGILRRLEFGSAHDIKSLSSRSSYYSDRRTLRGLGLFPPSSTQIELPGLKLPPISDLLSNVCISTDIIGG